MRTVVGPRRLVLLVVLAVTAAGCSADVNANEISCADIGALTLIAQAVPEAETVPCFIEAPFAFRTTTFDVQSGTAEVNLSHAVLGNDVAILTIARDCVVAEGDAAADVPDRGRRVDATEEGASGGIVGHWTQGLGGACLVVQLNMDHPDGERAAADLDGSWRLLPRADLAHLLELESDGRLILDGHRAVEE